MDQTVHTRGYRQRGKTMSDSVEDLRKRLNEIEKKIREVEARMPAHSVKPPIMHELFELEDERDSILAELKKLKSAE